MHSIYIKFRKILFDGNYERRTNFVLENIEAQNKILILGARDSFVKRIVEHTGNKLKYYLVDKHPSEIKNSNFTYQYSDLNESIPYSDDYFDCVIADQLIEHLSKPDTFLKEIIRVGKNDCKVIIGSENLAAWHNIIALFFGFHPFSDHYSENIRAGNPVSIHHKQIISDPYMRHVKVPTIRALKELMEYYGYKISSIKGFAHLLPFGVLFDKYHSIQFVMVSYIRKNQCMNLVNN